MTTPSWRRIPLQDQDPKKAGLVRVEAKPAGYWNMVLPFVPGSRLLRFTVQEKDSDGAAAAIKWRLSAEEECGADGSAKGNRSTALVPNAPVGALVGKLGGSTADLPDAGTTATSGVYTGRKVFAVGSYAVIALAATDSGPLFLTMNDSTDSFQSHSGSLWVLLEEAPL